MSCVFCGLLLCLFGGNRWMFVDVTVHQLYWAHHAVVITDRGDIVRSSVMWDRVCCKLYVWKVGDAACWLVRGHGRCRHYFTGGNTTTATRTHTLVVYCRLAAEWLEVCGVSFLLRTLARTHRALIYRTHLSRTSGPGPGRNK